MTGERTNVNQWLHIIVDYVHKELHEEGAYLLPLRLFMGIGWMRAMIEKLMEPGWYDGSALRAFLEAQLSAGHIQFPLYETLIQTVFLPNVYTLSWIIIIGQGLVGIGIFTGTFTNLALLGGLFMNFNFILIGRVAPSAFYVVIQIVLFISNNGSVLGVDNILDKYINSSFFVAQNDYKRKFLLIEKTSFLVLAVIGFAFAGYAFFHIQDFSPHSIEDSAMLLFILSNIGATTLLIAHFRLQPHDIDPPRISSPSDLIFVEGAVGNYVTWKVEDDNPDQYTIMSDGKVVQSGSWSANDEIAYNVDHLTAGTHRLVLTAIDWYGNSNTDAVIVSVLDAVKTDANRSLQLVQYFREMLQDQIENYEHSLNTVNSHKANLTQTMEALSQSERADVYQKYNSELTNLAERSSYLEHSIQHVKTILDDIDDYQFNQTHNGSDSQTISE